MTDIYDERGRKCEMEAERMLIEVDQYASPGALFSVQERALAEHARARL